MYEPSTRANTGHLTDYQQWCRVDDSMSNETEIQYPPSYEDELFVKLDREIRTLAALGSIEARRWFVKRVVLDPTSRDIISRMEPSDELVKMAHGDSPSPEHAGIAARLLYEHMDRKDLVLNLPTLAEPKLWNEAEFVTEVMVWAFQPWKEFRYDPRTETVQVVLSNGQWAFHLKGKDTEGYMIRAVQKMMTELRTIGFNQVTKALVDQGLLSMNPADLGIEASDLVKAFQASEVAFRRFLTSKASAKEVVDQLQRLPIMMFDTSTVNSVQGFAALGNGVVPTEDIHEIGEGYDIIRHPAGSLLPADPEFVLSNAAGLAWPEHSQFNGLMTYRARIYSGELEYSWDEWYQAAQVFAEKMLTERCPTYKAFLDHAFPHSDTEPPEERDAFLRLLGAAVFGSNLKILAAFIGAPNAGKDTVIKWLSYIMGSGQVGMLSPMALTVHADPQRAFAPLKGAKLAVVSGEVGDGRSGAILAESLKSITSGGGLLTVAEKYEKPTTIFFDGMLIMQGNSVPQIQGGDKALYKNRLVAVEFKHPFPLQAKNYEYLYQREAPSFLQVLFLHYLDYVQRGTGLQGIAPPKAWRDFGGDIELAADPLAVIERCITRPDANIEIPTTIFYKALSILAERTLGYRYQLSSRAWASRLKKAGVSQDKSAKNPWRSQVTRPDYRGWVFHFTLDPDQSDGFFTEQDWTNALQTATVNAV